jgi:hypothetical protein
MRGIQTNVNLTLEGRAKLKDLCARTRRTERDVIEILLSQAIVADEPDIRFEGLVPSAPRLGGDDAA